MSVVHRSHGAPLLILSLLGSPASWGGPVVDVRPTNCVLIAAESTTVAVGIDFGGDGSLGGYGSTLAWDPSVLAYVGHVGGAPPFNDPVVNTGDVGLGLLHFADASVPGVGGLTIVIEVTFAALEAPPAATALDLELTSLFDAESYANVLPEATVRDSHACTADFAFDLRVGPAAMTVLDWSPIAQAASYDVIRGNLTALRANPVGMLGAVDCLEAGSADTTTGAGTEPANPDVELPPPGDGYFYLVRFNDAMGSGTYGYVEQCGVERLVSSGDCPTD